MEFDPEDQDIGGPRCRNCHRGSSGCGGCHNTSGGVNPDGHFATTQEDEAAAADNSRSDITQFFYSAMSWTANGGTMSRTAALTATEGYKAYTMYNPIRTADGRLNEVASTMGGADASILMSGQIKQERGVDWSGWTDKAATANPTCSDDGLSWPHRTLGYMMLKDDLFGIDVTGRTDGQSTVIGPNETRAFGGSKTHDIDSVCLDCHNPTIFNATNLSHDDSATISTDDYNDDMILRGLP